MKLLFPHTAYYFFLLTCLPIAQQAQTPVSPKGLVAKAFELHIDLLWTPNAESNVTGYKIYRSTDGGQQFQFLKQVGKTTRITDWTGDEGQNLTRHYRVTALSNNLESPVSATVSATTFGMTDAQLFDMEQEAAFRYFWDFGHPFSGLARERDASGDIVTTGGSGFGVMAIITGVERGWITREEGLQRLILMVSFYQIADRFHGVFPHWMDGISGNVVPFSQYDNGGDLVETAFLMQGLLCARQYFNQNDPNEQGLRDAINSLWRAVEWDWYRRNGSNVLYWHWSTNYGWQMNFPLRGFNETQIVYLLAAASPTHVVPGSLYQSGWLASAYKNIGIYFGLPIYCGPSGGGPMFFAHYSYLGFDPRSYKDEVCNYFVRNKNHALIQVAYSKANPKNFKGYSADCWGLTACDGPNGYAARDIFADDGTIAPTAALASMPYTPEQSMAALRHFYRNIGEKLWGVYGFYDAFNLQKNWFANSYLAIDQGPIVAMMENHRTGLFWRLFMSCPEIGPALQNLGFQKDNSSTQDLGLLEQQGFEASVFPNPAIAGQAIQLRIACIEEQQLSFEMIDLNGRRLDILTEKAIAPTGISTINISPKIFTKGLCLLKISNEKGATQTLSLVLCAP